MRLISTSLAALVVVACAGQPPAQPQAAPKAQAAPTAPGTQTATEGTDDSQRLICEDQEITGTRVRRTQRVCETVEDRARRRAQNEQAISDMANRSRQNAPSGK